MTYKMAGQYIYARVCLPVVYVSPFVSLRAFQLPSWLCLYPYSWRRVARLQQHERLIRWLHLLVFILHRSSNLLQWESACYLI
jgi:hypothetical protein